MTDLSIRIYAMVTTAMASLGDKIHSDERGQDLIEWVMLSGVLAAALIGLLTLFDTPLQNMATNIGHCIDFNNNTACTPGF